MKSRLLVIVVFLLIIPVGGAYAQNQYYLPHVTNGSLGGLIYRTTFILLNNSNAVVAAHLSLTDESGGALTVTLGNLGIGSQFDITLDAGTTAILQTDGLGNGAVGAASVTATSTIGVSAVFTVYDATGNYITEAGLGSSVPATEFVLPVDATGPYNTGLALFNVSNSTAAITAILTGPDGSEVARTPISLNPTCHMAAFVAGPNQLFPAISNFRGTLVIQSPVPVAALVLRQYQQGLSQTSYTSLPAVPRSSSKLVLNIAHVANGSAGISFRTSFLMFNISAISANVVLALTRNDGSPFSVTIPGSGPATGTNSSFNFSLAPGAAVFLQTDGLGSLTTGSATITSNVPIGASAVFTVLDYQGQFQTEAGVGDSPVLASLTLPVDVTGSFDTGIAFFNPGGTSMTLNFTLLDAGGVLVRSTAQILGSKCHVAEFATELFPGLSNFRGSLAVSTGGSVAAMTLRQYKSGSTYTTLPTVSGISTGTPQIAPLLTKTVTGISILASDPDVGWSDRLASGFAITGTVSGSGQGLQVIASAGGNNVFSSPINPLTGKYLVVVPSGTYTLTACYQPAAAAATPILTVTYVDPVPVQVSDSVIRDITLPAITLFNVSGTVSGLNSLPSGASATIVFGSNDNSSQGQFPLDASGGYQGVLPAGSYTASIGGAAIQFSPLQTESLGLYNVGSLTVGGGPAAGDYVIPATAVLSGTISREGLSSLPPGSSVTAIDVSASPPSKVTCCAPAAVSLAAADLSSQYQMILAQNRSFTTSVSVPVGQGTGFLGTINYPLSSSTVNLGGNTTFNFNIPVLPGVAALYGNISDGFGHVLANVTVSAYSQSIQNVPNLGFSASTRTDIYGNYILYVLSGTNYRLLFVPPVPKY